MNFFLVLMSTSGYSPAFFVLLCCFLVWDLGIKQVTLLILRSELSRFPF